MTVAYTWDLKAYISSTWTSIARDVMIWDYPLVVESGIDGAGISYRVASPGSLTCVMDNSPANSGGLLGYYSPRHANARANFGRGTRLRQEITYNGTTVYLWHGWMEELEPTPGQFKNPTASLTAWDFMQKALEHKLKGIAVQMQKRGDQLVQTVLDNMMTSPANTSLETDTFELPLGLHTEQDENSTALSALQKICQTTQAYAFVTGDATDGETFVYQREMSRLTSTSVATLDDTMSGVKFIPSDENRHNKVVGLIHPSEVEADGDTVLAKLSSDIWIAAGETQSITLRFRDPAGRSVRISGKDIITTLETDTHYRMGSSSGQNDMNAYLTPTVTPGGNAVTVQLENTGSVRGCVSKLEIIGNGIYAYEPVEIVVESGDGDQPVSYDMYYLDDPFRGKAFATAMHARATLEKAAIESVYFFADADATLMGYALTCKVGSRVTLAESATGLGDDYIINKRIVTIQTDTRLRVEWLVEPVGTYSFFQLDVSELDGTDVLSPY